MAAANDDTASTAPLISASHEDIARHSEGETDIKPAPPVPNPAPQAADKAEQRQNPKASTSCACKGGGRNLVVCIDGTANQFSYKNTNVVELYSRLIEDENQLTYYNSGIGTYARDSKTSFHYWKQKIDHTIDMAIAWNFKKIVLDAYEWLSENYIPGDRIFLFGFSRGAYQVRVIAGMIELVGLVRKGNKGQIKFAYDLYMDMIGHRHNSSQSSAGTIAKVRAWLRNKLRWSFRPGRDTTALQQDEPEIAPAPKPIKSKKRREHKTDPLELSERFKRTLCRKGVKVHFVGAWDTVSSIGVARAPSLPETTTGMTHVCAFRHALALDEVRVKFLPEYANAGVGPTADTQAVNVKEVWFSGSHSDIGGGSDLNLDLDKFGPALRWMSYEALKEGLRMIDFRGNWQQLKPTNSMRWYWRILECLPFRRLSYDSKKEKEHAVYFPHLSSPRQIMHGQRIHESVIDSPSQREIIYEPFIGPLSQSETFKLKKSERSAWKRRARVPDGLKWDQVIASDDWIERDPYKSANRIVDGILGGNLSDEDCHVLVTLSSSDVGQRSMTDYANADELFKAFMAVKLAIAAGPPTEQHERQLIGLLIVLGAFQDLSKMDEMDNGEQSWMRETAERLSNEQPQPSSSLGQASAELSRLFRARVQRLLDELMRETWLSDGERDVLCTIVETDFGRNTLAAIADGSKLLNVLEAAKRDLHWSYRRERITDLLTLLGSLPSLSRGTERYWQENVAELHGIVEWHRPVVRRAIDRISRPLCDRAPNIVDNIVSMQLSDTERNVLDALLYTESGRQSIANCKKVEKLLDTLKKLVLSDDIMDLDLRRVRITDLAVALCASGSLCSAELLPERLFIAVLSHVDTERLDFTKATDQIMQDICDTAGNVVAKLADAGLSEADHILLNGLLTSEFGKLGRTASTIVARLFEALERQQGAIADVEPELRQIHASDITRLLGTFSSLPDGARQYRKGVLRELLSGADQEQAGIPEAVDRTMKVFDGRLLLKLRGHSGIVLSVAFSPDGTRMASGSGDRSIRIWAADTGKEILEPLLGHTDWVKSIAFSQNGKRLASGSDDDTVRLWDVEMGQQIGEPLRGHTDEVRSVAFSPDGNRIVSGSDDRTLRLWDAQTGQPIGGSLQGHTSDVLSVAFSPAGDRIASGSVDGTIRLWDAGTGKPVGDPLQGHDGWVWSVAYSPDGTRLVSASSDNTLRIWDTRTGKTVLGPLRGHTSHVISVAFSPDGKYIVSGSYDRTIRIWDAQTGQTVVGPLEAHTDWVRAVAFSPDGRRVVSGGGDGWVRIWDAEVD